MEYKGKLYGKVHKSYFPLIETTEDFDRLKEAEKIVISLGNVSHLGSPDLNPHISDLITKAKAYTAQNPK